MFAQLTWLLGAALVAGLALVALGLRGRRVDDHPVCRRCGRDLFGLAERPERCPECGGILSDRRVRLGNRIRRRPLVAAGAVLAAPGAFLGLVVIALGLTGTRADEIKPVWLLRWQAESWAPGSAMAELSRRVKDGDMRQEEVASLISLYLAQQADTGRAWLPEKGDFLEVCHLNNAAGPPGWWDTYLQQGIGPAIEARPVISAGRKLPVRLTASRLRLGSAAAPITGIGGLPISGGLTVGLVVFAEPEAGEAYTIGSTSIIASTLDPTSKLDDWISLPGWRAALPPGGEASLRLAIDPGLATQATLGSRCWTAPVRLVARQERSVGLVDGAAPIQAASFEIELPLWWHVAHLSGLQDHYEKPDIVRGVVRLKLADDPGTAPASYAVFVRDGTTEHVLGSFLAKDGSVEVTLGRNLKGFDIMGVTGVQVLLRPCPDTAETSLDVFEICGDEVLMRDVGVRYPAWFTEHRARTETARGREPAG